MREPILQKPTRGDAGHQSVGFLAPVIAHQHLAGAAGQIGHARATLVEDQVQAGTQPIPAVLERCDARCACWFPAQLCSRKGFRSLGNPLANRHAFRIGLHYNPDMAFRFQRWTKLISSKKGDSTEAPANLNAVVVFGVLVALALVLLVLLVVVVAILR